MKLVSVLPGCYTATSVHLSVYPVQKLKVLFAVGSDGEVSEPLEVSALNCDTVEQVKVKILSSFKAKFGFPYSYPLRELCVGKRSTLLLLQSVFNVDV